MSIIFECDECETRYEVDEDAAGDAFLCSHCRAEIIVPVPDSEDQQVAESNDSPESAAVSPSVTITAVEDSTTDENNSESQPVDSDTKYLVHLFGFAAAGIFLFAVAAAGIWALVDSFGPSAEQPKNNVLAERPPNDEQAEIGQLNAEIEDLKSRLDATEEELAQQKRKEDGRRGGFDWGGGFPDIWQPRQAMPSMEEREKEAIARFGKDRVLFVEVQVLGMRSAQPIYDRLRAIAKPSYFSGHQQGGEASMIVSVILAPVDNDVKSFAAKIDFGEVTDTDEKERVIEIQADPKKLPAERPASPFFPRPGFQLDPQFPADWPKNPEIRTRPDSKPGEVIAEWAGRWWPVEVLKQDGNRYFVRYKILNSHFDRWIDSSEIHFGEKAVDEESK